MEITEYVHGSVKGLLDRVPVEASRPPREGSKMAHLRPSSCKAFAQGSACAAESSFSISASKARDD